MASAAPLPVSSESDSCGVKSSSGDKKATGWLLASYACNHMTGDASLLSDLKPTSEQVVVPAGDGKGKHVHGIGAVITQTVVLPDVWYVPGLLANLASVHQLATDPDLFIGFAGSGCHVERISDGSVVGRGRLRSDNKYELDFLRIPQN